MMHKEAQARVANCAKEDVPRRTQCGLEELSILFLSMEYGHAISLRRVRDSDLIT